jgi:hypothetical protein
MYVQTAELVGLLSRIDQQTLMTATLVPGGLQLIRILLAKVGRKHFLPQGSEPGRHRG